MTHTEVVNVLIDVRKQLFGSWKDISVEAEALDIAIELMDNYADNQSGFKHNPQL